MKLQFIASAVLAAIVLSGPVLAAPYTFTNVADSSGTLGTSISSVRLGNNGLVSFIADKDAGGRGVFTGNSSTLTTIDAVGTGSGFAVLRNAEMSASGARISYYRAEASGNWGLRAWNGATTTPLTNALNYDISAINNAGMATWVGEHGAPGQERRTLFIGNGSNNQPVHDVQQYDGDVLWDAQPSISGANNVVFGTTQGPKFLNTTTGQVTTLSPYSAHEARINESGTITFNGGSEFGLAMFYARSEGGGPDTLIKSSRPGFVLSQFDMNNVGDIAYVVSGQPNGDALYFGVEEARVIGLGDALFGSTLTGFSYEPGALNDLGQMAFRYTLADGRVGVAVATVPEPASGVALTMAAGMMCRRRRRA